MAITPMTKFMIVSHHSQASELLEVLQDEGICQILNTEEAMVTKDSPELAAAVERPKDKDIEGLLNWLQDSIIFLRNYVQAKKGLAAVFSPRTVIDNQSYNAVINKSQEILKIVGQVELTESAIEMSKSEIENLNAALRMLEPFKNLETPVEEIGPMRNTTCWAGLLPHRLFEQVEGKISEFDGAIQQIGTTTNRYACLVVSLNEKMDEVQKLLRSAEFEQVTFEPMAGKVANLIKQHTEKLNEAKEQLQSHYERAASLSKNLLKLEILYDYYQNLLNREQTKGTAPATEHTVILEGWVKKHNYKRLEKTVSRFDAASVTKIEPAEGEEIPVEIENRRPWRPFEVITRLYGMPQHFEVDPTVFLAPFFAIFFALCLTDAGYGLVIIALMIFFIKKIQGDKKLMWMLGICSAVTVVAGALTGGWFGDAIQQFIPALKPVRKSLMWFDPLKDPMIFFKLALGLGYFQIMTGLVVAFVHKIKQKEYVSAVCDHLTWLVMLNSIALLLASKFGAISARTGNKFGLLALVPAAIILLFSHREGSWPGRIGMGAYNVFSTIFYIGDVLSYLRLMALGMVTAGLAMAINVIAKIVGNIPYGIGIIAMILVLVGGHAFNMGINALGAFVHTLRLQYVEFFPKFFVGGGRSFEPLNKKYQHIYIKKSDEAVK
jgi:V/A-type H+-transporting ATPase subunit I